MYERNVTDALTTQSPSSYSSVSLWPLVSDMRQWKLFLSNSKAWIININIACMKNKSNLHSFYKIVLINMSFMFIYSFILSLWIWIKLNKKKKPFLWNSFYLHLSDSSEDIDTLSLLYYNNDLCMKAWCPHLYDQIQGLVCNTKTIFFFHAFLY